MLQHFSDAPDHLDQPDLPSAARSVEGERYSRIGRVSASLGQAARAMLAKETTPSLESLA